MEIPVCTHSSLLPFPAASKAAKCTGPLGPLRLALPQAGGLLPGPAMSPLVPPDTPAGQGPLAQFCLVYNTLISLIASCRCTRGGAHGLLGSPPAPLLLKGFGNESVGSARAEQRWLN